MLLKVKPISFVLATLVIGLPTSLLAQAKADEPISKVSIVQIPSIGCESDGQMGPIPAPKETEKPVQLDSAVAQRLAYYGDDVLAPRGWFCFGTYGSNGTNLYVSPKPIKKEDLFSASWKGFTGPAIQAGRIFGETSGRFEVAQFVARVFPAQRAFVQDIIKEEIEPASDFPFGPYPKDQLSYRNDKIVEYITPSNSKGLGTMSQLHKNNNPISGVVRIDGQVSNGISFIAIRLPSNMNDLTSTIIQQFEQDTQ